MSSVTIKLNYTQVKELVDQLDKEDTIKLAEYLDEKTVKERFSAFLERKKGIPISFKEITEEVEIVRKERYK